MVTMENLNQVERIKIKLRLARNTDSFLEIHGASSHEYKLDKPISLDEVQAFEIENNISLPHEYKVFLTEIGNGGNEEKSVVGNSGAGPNYGIFKLGHKYHNLGCKEYYFDKPPFFHKGITEEKWKEILDEKGFDGSNDDELIASLFTGILVIGYQGCCGFYGLMLAGENKGRVIKMTDEIVYCPAFKEEKNFLDWYENWLDDVIFGSFFSSNNIKAEEKLFERYSKANDRYWKLIALKDIRKCQTISKEFIEFLCDKYLTEEDEVVKLYLLNLLVKFDYDNTTEELSKLSVNNPLEFLKILHLFAKEKIVKWNETIEKLYDDKDSSKEIKEYIKYVIQYE